MKKSMTLFYRGNHDVIWLKNPHFSRNLLEVWNTYLHFIFNRIMHAYSIEVCIRVRYDVCKLGNFHSPLYGCRDIYTEKHLSMKYVDLSGKNEFVRGGHVHT